MPMGRPRVSDELHRLKGTRPTRAKDNTDEPTVSSGRPKMPKTLSALEIEAWKGAAKIMKSRGTLSKGDAENLELWAVTKARWILARRDVEKRGLEIVETRHTKSGDPYEVSVPNPSLKICTDCETRLLSYSKVLGLAAMDRTKVKKTRGAAQQRVMSADSAGVKFAHLFQKENTKVC